MKRFMVVMCIVLLTGCSVASPIQRADISESGFTGAIVGGDHVVLETDATNSIHYRIYHKGATGFVPLTTLRESAETRARNFCNDKSKRLKLLEETSATVSSGWPSWPRIEYVFMCE